MKSIELPKADLHLIEEGFVLLKFKDNATLEIEDAKKIDQDIFEKLIYGKPFVVIIDARNIMSSISHEARDFFSKDKLVKDIRMAQALVVNNIHTKLLADFYMNFHKPENKVKVFKDFDEAFKWCKLIKDNL